METIIRADRPIWERGVRLYLAERREFGLFVAQPVQLAEKPEHLEAEPFLRLRDTEAQRLMDELWNCGFRPTEGTGSAGSLAATERHLKDMQTIALGLLQRDGMKT